MLQATGSAAAMGGVLICASAPMLLFLLLGGVAVDRIPRAQVMLASDLARCLLVGALAGLALDHQLALWHVYAASLAFGVVDAFFQPAYSAMVPEVAPAGALPGANALTSLSAQAGRIAGPALGAALVAAGGTSLAFALDGISFAASAACLVPLSGLPAPARREGASPGDPAAGLVDMDVA